MSSHITLRSALIFALAATLQTSPSRGEDRFPVLKVRDQFYTNVVITEVTVTDIYFTHSMGIGNAKLKQLDEELQKRFQFNADKARATEQGRIQANALFREDLARRQAAAAPKAVEEVEGGQVTTDEGDVVVSQLYAKSFRGQRPPSIIVEQWATPAPDVTGKFVFVVFWTTWCEPCKAAIPELNQLQAQFRERLVVIGLSDEPLESLQKLSSPRIEYASGTDTQSRTLKSLVVEAIPHALLIDPKGIVRYEGIPGYLTAEALEHLMAKYGE